MAAGLVIVLMMVAHEVFSFSSPANLKYYQFKIRAISMQKNLLVDLRGCGYELAVLDPLGRNQFASDLMHFVATPPDDDDLQTIVFIQMNVQAGIHGHMSLMLHVRQEIAQVMHPVVIDESDNPDDFGIRQPDLLLDEMVTNEVADGFRAILIALTADASIECLQQIIFE
jgi:hypothetical protein